MLPQVTQQMGDSGTHMGTTPSYGGSGRVDFGDNQSSQALALPVPPELSARRDAVPLPPATDHHTHLGDYSPTEQRRR